MFFLENISGLIYLLSIFLLSRTILDKWKKVDTLLVCVVLIYLQVLFLSLIFSLRYEFLTAFGILNLAFVFLSKKNKFVDFNYKDLRLTDFSIVIVYGLYAILLNISGFNYDDVLTTYIPRVNSWIYYETIFPNLDLEPYYYPILNYPPLGQLNLLLINIFKFNPTLNIIFSLYIVSSIYRNLKNLIKLNHAEKQFLKLTLFLSPIVLTLSTSGLSDLLFYYFFISCLVNMFNYLNTKNNFYLNLSIIISIISVSVRFHGVILVFIVGVILLIKSFNKRTIIQTFKSAVFSSLLFLGPFTISLLSFGKINYILGTLNSQLNQNLEIKFGDNELLRAILFNQEKLLKYFLNLYNSFSHIILNFTFADFPFIFLLPELVTKYNTPNFLNILFKFQIFTQPKDLRTTGIIIFSFVSIFVFYTYFHIIKAFISDKKVKFKKFDNEKDKILLSIFVFSTYFFIISLRDFSSANFRYITPVFLLLLPFSIKLINFNKSKILLSTFVLVIYLSSLQPLITSEMLWEKPYPDFILTSQKSPATRGWHSDYLEVEFNEIINHVDTINMTKKQNSMVISLKSKFPIGVFKNINLQFLTHNKTTFLNKEFFKDNKASVFLTDNKNIQFDKQYIYLLKSFGANSLEDSQTIFDNYKNSDLLNNYDYFIVLINQ